MGRFDSSYFFFHFFSAGLKELHSLLKPYLLRRTKEEVLKDLPKKSEIVMFHGISKLQKKLYKAILTKDISK
jgi:SNF2 family DNA or RNA helicase